MTASTNASFLDERTRATRAEAARRRQARLQGLLEDLDVQIDATSDPQLQRLMSGALGSARWLAFAVEHQRQSDAMQARQNLVEAVAPLRTSRRPPQGYLSAVDELMAYADAELGGALARSEAELAALRVHSLLRQLERCGREPALHLVLALDELLEYLRARAAHAPSVATWIEQIELALGRLRRGRRSATMMVTGVLNDVIHDERSLCDLEREDTEPGR